MHDVAPNRRDSAGCPGAAHSIAGFSLIEVMVALIVLSIGMLGIAGMQVRGLQFGQQALVSTRAIGLAGDMADRIRANSAAGVVSPGDAYAVGNQDPAATPPFPCADTDTFSVTAVAVCTPLELADYDIWDWKTDLKGSGSSGLPNGKGQVAYGFDDGVATFTIEVTWREGGEERLYQLVVSE